MRVRAATAADRPVIWALSSLPNVGATADPSCPLDLPLPTSAPGQWPDLVDVPASYTSAGGAFLVVEDDGVVIGTGGYRPDGEVVRVRVHPARRRRGVGTLLMDALADDARRRGIVELHLDTADNQPGAMAFYDALGYERVGTETQSGWTWTLVYYRRRL